MKREPTRGDRLLKTMTVAVRQANDADRTIEHVITARTVDRDGDVVEPMGVRTDNFKKNPVVLLGHSSWGFPVARNLALDKSPDQIVALTQFAGLDQAAPEAETAYRLARDGFMRAWSIGFMPVTWSEDKALPTQDGWWFKETELYEYSLVAIPSNPEALSRMAKGLALPAGASEADFLDAVRKDRKRYFDIGAALLIGAKTVPSNPGNAKAPKDAAWSAPSLADFTSKGWGDLSDAEKNAIAQHFAWADELPPKSFGDLKLPHHNPGGAVVFRGVAAAAARLDQTQGIDAAAVKAHLAHHYGQFGEQVPWKSADSPQRKQPAADAKDLILAALTSIFGAAVASLRAGDGDTADALTEVADDLAEILAGDTADDDTAGDQGSDNGGWPSEPTPDPGGPVITAVNGHRRKLGAVLAQRNRTQLQQAQGHLAAAAEHHTVAMKSTQSAAECVKAVMDDAGAADDGTGPTSDGQNNAAVAAIVKDAFAEYFGVGR